MKKHLHIWYIYLAFAADIGILYGLPPTSSTPLLIVATLFMLYTGARSIVLQEALEALQ